MKCTYHWLKEFVEFNYSPEELGEQLTSLGLEVDTTESVSRNIKGAIVGEITEQVSDNQCKINTGKKIAIASLNFAAVPKFSKVVLLPDLSGNSPYQVVSYRSLGILEDDSPVYVGESFENGASIETIIPMNDTIYDLVSSELPGKLQLQPGIHYAFQSLKSMKSKHQHKILSK